MIALCALMSSTFLANQATSAIDIDPHAANSAIKDEAGLDSTPYMVNTFSGNDMQVSAEAPKTIALNTKKVLSFIIKLNFTNSSTS